MLLKAFLMSKNAKYTFLFRSKCLSNNIFNKAVILMYLLAQSITKLILLPLKGIKLYPYIDQKINLLIIYKELLENCLTYSVLS